MKVDHLDEKFLIKFVDVTPSPKNSTLAAKFPQNPLNKFV